MTVVDVVDATSGQPNTYFDEERHYWQDWGWSHTFSPPGPTPAVINWARLEIAASDIIGNATFGPEIDEIWVGRIDAGLKLGQLEESSGSYTTVFDLPHDVLGELLDGTVDISIDIDSLNPGLQQIWSANVVSSTLTVNYEPVPVPAAFILGSIGLGLAGWRLRRHA